LFLMAIEKIYKYAATRTYSPASDFSGNVYFNGIKVFC
jgi:hypothetical protein